MLRREGDPWNGRKSGIQRFKTLDAAFQKGFFNVSAGCFPAGQRPSRTSLAVGPFAKRKEG